MSYHHLYTSLKTPQVGELGKRIAIYRCQDQPTGTVDIQQTLSGVLKAWAKIVAVGAQVYYSSKQTGDNVTHRFIVRTVPSKIDARSITLEHVIEYDGLRYRIRRVNDIGKTKLFTVIEATELGEADDRVKYTDRWI